MNDKKKLLIIGAGGHGRAAADIARLNGYHVRFLDDSNRENAHVIGKVSDYRQYLADYCFFVAIGDNRTRKTIMEELMANAAEMVTLIHPAAVVAADVSLAQGSVVMAGAVINTGAKIGKGVIVNTCSSVDHDCIVDDYVHIAVGSHLAGTVHVGALTLIGAGATVINNLQICAECIIGAGGVVIRNIEKKGTYVGVPVRWIR